MEGKFRILHHLPRPTITITPAKGVLYIPQISKPGSSPSDCLMLYLGYSVVGKDFYSSAEMQSVYSTAPADWASHYCKKNSSDIFQFITGWIRKFLPFPKV